MNRRITLLTYNLLFNTAGPSLGHLIEEYSPDILTLQEIDTSTKNLESLETHGFKLAGSATCFVKKDTVFGIATFYNAKTITCTLAQPLGLSYSFYEFFLMLLRGGNRPRAVLHVECIHKATGKDFQIFNLHLSPHGTNGIRRKQMHEIFAAPELSKRPSIIAGDFNFPYHRKRFQEVIQTYGLEEATKNITKTFETKLLGLIPIKFKLDYILYKGLKHLSTVVLPVKHSDHYPLVAVFEL